MIEHHLNYSQTYPWVHIAQGLKENERLGGIQLMMLMSFETYVCVTISSAIDISRLS